jgi:hypothetical protein
MFVGHPPDQPGAASVLWKAASYLAVPVLLSTIAAALRNQTAAERREWAILRKSLAIWLMLHAAVFTWWDVGNVHFWVMAAVGAARLGGSNDGPPASPVACSGHAAIFGGPFQSETCPRATVCPSPKQSARTEPDATVTFEKGNIRAMLVRHRTARMIATTSSSPTKMATGACAGGARRPHPPISSEGGVTSVRGFDEAPTSTSRRHGFGSARRLSSVLCPEASAIFALASARPGLEPHASFQRPVGGSASLPSRPASPNRAPVPPWAAARS